VRYAVSAAVLAALFTSCELTEFGCIDYDLWHFENSLSVDLQVTPLYRAHDGSVAVVPRHGWTQTEFVVPARSSTSFNLETGDFPFQQVLVESGTGSAWTLAVSGDRIHVGHRGVPATPEQVRAKSKPAWSRLARYLVAIAIPFLWVVPPFLLDLVSLRRSRPSTIRGTAA
jgi:hypothetical protein